MSAANTRTVRRAQAFQVGIHALAQRLGEHGGQRQHQEQQQEQH
mgnify:CR=1 FL=1